MSFTFGSFASIAQRKDEKMDGNVDREGLYNSEREETKESLRSDFCSREKRSFEFVKPRWKENVGLKDSMGFEGGPAKGEPRHFCA